MMICNFIATPAYGRQCMRAFFRARILRSWWLVPAICILLGAVCVEVELFPHSAETGTILFWLGWLLVLLGAILFQVMQKTFDKTFVGNHVIVRIEADALGLAMTATKSGEVALPSTHLDWGDVSAVRKSEDCWLFYRRRKPALIVPEASLSAEMNAYIQTKRE
jgi:hypothetical protein